jgi:hypothetical protein
MIDKSRPDRIASRVGNATAAYYPVSRRVILMADRAAFADAQQALTELRDEVS